MVANYKPPYLKDKLLGGLYGLLLGDAVGTPYEFKSPMNIPSYDQIDMIPPEGYNRSWRHQPLAIWSDDGSQALCLLEYYIDGDLSIDAWGRKLQRWGGPEAHMWFNNRSFDMGLQTRHAIDRLNNGVPASEAGHYDEQSNGNGSLMRALPTALWYARENIGIESYQNEVDKISKVTHPHEQSLLCCRFYNWIASKLLDQCPFYDALDIAWDVVECTLHTDAEKVAWEVIRNGQHKEPNGTGYVVDALWSAIHCIKSTNSFADCIRSCIELGHDTDTTACIAGGLAGIMYGYDALPERWLELLKGKEVVQSLAEKLLQHHEI